MSQTIVKSVRPGACGENGYKNNRGEPCGQYRIRGMDACRRHVGKTLSKAKAHGAIRTTVLAWNLDEPTADPTEVMLRLVTVTARRAQHYAAELDKLYAEQGAKALVGESWGEGGKTGEYIRGLARLEQDERKLAGDLASKAIAAGLAERTVRLAEAQGQMLFAVMRRLVERLDRDPDDPAVRMIAAEVVREITAG